jgi:hypothetical protein
MDLGNQIIGNFDDDKIEKVFMDLDFQERTLLKIISDNSFSPLFASYKVNILLEEIWVGKKSYECDGDLDDFSIIRYLAGSSVKKIPGKKMTAKELVSNNFVVNMHDQKYWY